MKKLLPLIALVCCCFISFAQEGNIEQEVTATVINAQTDFPLESVHIVNLNKVKGTITNKEGIPQEGSVRYFINVGERDDYDWMSLKDFLRDTLNLDKDDIYKVDTKDTFSFFNTDAKFTPLILETFSDFKVDGRFVNVEVSKNPGGGRGRSRGGSGGGGRRDRNRGGGGRRDRNSSYSGGGRRGRKGSSNGGSKSKGKGNKGFY